MGQNTKEIKKRIKSVINTKKITKTMEMVSTAKSKKAQDRVRASQPYNQKVREIISRLVSGDEGPNSPLLAKRENPKKTLLLILASNRGLCGAYNTNVMKMGRDKYRELTKMGRDVEVVVVGKKAVSFMKFNGVPVSQSHTDIDDKLSYEAFEKMPVTIMERFLNFEIDEFLIVYTKYFSAARQYAVLDQLLPFTLGVQEKKEIEQPAPSTFVANYLFEPDAESILNEILPYAFKMNLFQFFLESFTAEHIYRRIAMKSATDAASDMIKSLTRSYNRARQAKITQEISEIIGGVSALQ